MDTHQRKSIPLEPWTGPQSSRRLRLPQPLDNRSDIFSNKNERGSYLEYARLYVSHTRCASQSMHLLNNRHATTPSALHNGYQFRPLLRPSLDHALYRIQEKTYILLEITNRCNCMQ